MTQPLWIKLTSLVDIDKKINEIKAQILSSQKEIDNHKALIGNLANSLSEKNEKLKEYKKEIRSIELKTNEIDATEKTKKESLESIQNQKSYEAIQKELSLIAIERQDYEDKLVAKWQEVEALENSITKDSKLAEESTAKHQEDIVIENEKIKSLETSMQEITDEKKSKSSNIPENWLALYEKMKSKVSDPIVSLTNSSCSHCYYHALPQDISRIKRGELLHCKNCFRLLYYATEEASANLE